MDEPILPLTCRNRIHTVTSSSEKRSEHKILENRLSTDEQIQFPIQQRVAFGAGVGQKDPDLTIFQLASCATMLRGDSCRFFAAFANARFVNDQNRFGITQLLQDV